MNGRFCWLLSPLLVRVEINIDATLSIIDNIKDNAQNVSLRDIYIFFCADVVSNLQNTHRWSVNIVLLTCGLSLICLRV
jgi:hypothetical protein